MEGNPIRVLVVDDHALFREGLTALLMDSPTIEVVGEASDGDEAITMANEVEIDVILMDIRMKGTNGIEATRTIRNGPSEVKIIMLTMVEQDESLLAALRAGANGYLLKGADKKQVLKTVHSTYRGEALFSPAIAEQLSAFFRQMENTRLSLSQNSPFADLTEREREVLHLIASGLNNQEISQQLHISPKTVSNHISNIFSKLQVADRVEAVLKAREAGFGGSSGSIR